MEFSFVIPTVDRKEEIQECVSSIEKAFEAVKTLHPDINIEIIVVFNGIAGDHSIPKTKDPALLSMFRIEEKGPSRARNFGIAKSRGEYVVLLDDDAGLSEDFFTALIDSIQGRKERVFCCRLMEKGTSRCFSATDRLHAEKRLGRLDYQFFKGSALIVAREVLERTGAYDEDFGPQEKYRAGEESALFFRIKMAGEAVIYLPEPVIFHPVLDKTPPNKVFDYSYATGALLTKYAVLDKKYFWEYLVIITVMTLKNFLRILQKMILPVSIDKKDRRFRYRSALGGTIMGVRDYLRFG
jgi:glycosyltransferase involved in cell wall biosynthesis